MSIVLTPSAFTAAKSSSVRMTCLSFEVSKAFTISSSATSFSSFLQNFW